MPFWSNINNRANVNWKQSNIPHDYHRNMKGIGKHEANVDGEIKASLKVSPMLFMDDLYCKFHRDSSLWTIAWPNNFSTIQPYMCLPNLLNIDTFVNMFRLTMLQVGQVLLIFLLFQNITRMCNVTINGHKKKVCLGKTFPLAPFIRFLYTSNDHKG